jgi:hypothetical protein
LSDTINKIKSAHSTYQKNLSLLKQLQENLSSLRVASGEFQDLQSILGASSYIVSDMDATNKALVHEIQTYSSGSLLSIGDQIDDNASRFHKLSRHLACLEEELVGLKFTAELTRSQLFQLNSSMNGLRASLISARAAVSPLLKISKQTWVVIFRLCLNQELEDYRNHQRALSFFSVPLTLSYVCAKWRAILLSEPTLWGLIPIGPDSAPSPSKVERFGDLVKLNKSRFTIIFNLSTVNPTEKTVQTNAGGYRKATKTTTVKVDTLYCQISSAIPSGKDYAVHIITGDNDPTEANKITYLDFQRASKLILTVGKAGTEIWNVFYRFSRIRQLEIYDKGGRIALPNIAARLPYLTFLKIQFQDLPPFEMSNIFCTRLVELRVRHNGQTRMAPPAQTLCLPELQLLGITYPESSLFNNLEVPKLIYLELYGSNYDLPELAFGPTSRQTLARIHRLSMYDWEQKAEDADVILSDISPESGAGEIFKGLSSFTSSLQAVRFVDCKMKGLPLVELFKFRTESGNILLSQLRSVSFEGCSIITRAEYEEILQFYSNLNFSKETLF